LDSLSSYDKGFLEWKIILFKFHFDYVVFEILDVFNWLCEKIAVTDDGTMDTLQKRLTGQNSMS